MSIASVAKHKQEERQKRQQKIEELDRTKNEIRRKQIARLNAALQAIKEIQEGKYNQDDSVIGKGIVLEDHTSKQSTLPIPRARRPQQLHQTYPTKDYYKEIITIVIEPLREDGYSPIEYETIERIHYK